MRFRSSTLDRLLLAGIAFFAVFARGLVADEAANPVEIGRKAVRGVPAMNPPIWPMAIYDKVWTQWGLKEKPADFEAALRERYGMQPAPYENHGLPMGLHVSRGLFGAGPMNDCLICHAGTVAGQAIIGMPNGSLDFQSFFDELTATAGYKMEMPFRVSTLRGTVDPINPAIFLMAFRDANLERRPPAKPEFTTDVASDPPAWWLLKKKKTRNWTGGVQAAAVRLDMVNIFSPLNSGAQIRQHESTFEAIHAFILTVESPRYPFPVDRLAAERGRGIFEQTCARCHGTYGPDASYPNKVVPLAEIGTDPRLATGISGTNLHFLNESWLCQEKGHDGQRRTVLDNRGYQAPPLDGVWATAPYLHNSSAPTVYHVLDSKSRPTYFTRSYRTGADEYDTQKLGWKITVLDGPPGPDTPAHERRKIFDATRPGLGNAGHTYGDKLSETDRLAVIEYLKTL